MEIKNCVTEESRYWFVSLHENSLAELFINWYINRQFTFLTAANDLCSLQF